MAACVSLPCLFCSTRVVCGTFLQREGAQGTVTPITFPLVPGQAFCRTVFNPPVIQCPTNCVAAVQINTVDLPTNTTCICPAVVDPCPNNLGRCFCPNGGYSLCTAQGSSCQAFCDSSFNFWYGEWWKQYACPLQFVTKVTRQQGDSQVVDVTLVPAAPVPDGQLPRYPSWTWNLASQGPLDGRKLMRKVLRAQ